MSAPVTKPASGLVQLSDLLQKAKSQIALALPKHLTAERMIRMAMTLYGKSDQLRKCDPMSIIACVVQSSELGLELSSPLGHAWMVPYGNQATFQIGYKGFFELAFRSGKVSAFPMRTVYTNDTFKVRYGTSQEIIHEPAMRDRGGVLGYYACVYLKDGGRDFEWMSVEDVVEHRKAYVKNNRSDSPWNTAFDAMAMKTCVRMLAKRVPISTELTAASKVDEYQEAGQQLEIDLGMIQDRASSLSATIGASGANTVDDPPAEPKQEKPAPAAATAELPVFADAKLIASIKAELARTGSTAVAIFKFLDISGWDQLTIDDAVSQLAELKELETVAAPAPKATAPTRDEHIANITEQLKRLKKTQGFAAGIVGKPKLEQCKDSELGYILDKLTAMTE